MKVEIPIEYDDILIEIVTQNVIRAIQQSEKLARKIDDLPPYPNRKQVKKVLRIGDERLNQWIANGLKVIPFGKEMRFDRSDIQTFLNELKL